MVASFNRSSSNEARVQSNDDKQGDEGDAAIGGRKHMAGLNVAILGASGAVGSELIRLLEERNFPISSVRLLASSRSAGRKVDCLGQEVEIQEVRAEAFDGVDIAFFSAGGSVSRQWAPIAVEKGALVIDNTSAFRLDPEVPLVVPEANAHTIKEHRGLIANPNCSTIILVMAVAPIHRRSPIRRIVVSTYQAVSGAGTRGIQELEDQVRAYVEGRPIKAQVLPVASLDKHHQIAFNILPQIDVFDDMDYTKEEWKMVNETRKVLGTQELGVSATTVRVPVFRSHAESINVETSEPLSLEEVRSLFQEAEGVEVYDDPQALEYPTPLHASGKDPVYIGRLRKDPSHPNAINMFVVGDQIRKGAALNAVQIAEYAAQHDLLKPVAK